MTTNVVPFDFEGSQVRVVTKNGEPWFVLADVCRVLEIGNSSDAASRLDDDEKGVVNVDTPGGYQNMTIVNESGLYALILTSRKPEAKRLRKWVTAEVIPSIRKTGAYVAPLTTPTDPVLALSQCLQTTIGMISDLRKDQLSQGGKIEAVEKRQTELSAVVHFNESHLSILAYSKLHGIDQIVTRTVGLSAKLGKEAMALSRKLGYEVFPIPDARFAYVHAYHREVLKSVFEKRFSIDFSKPANC